MAEVALGLEEYKTSGLQLSPEHTHAWWRELRLRCTAPPCDTVWRGVGVVWSGIYRYVTEWACVWYGFAVVWNDVVWCGRCGVVWCGLFSDGLWWLGASRARLTLRAPCRWRSDRGGDRGGGGGGCASSFPVRAAAARGAASEHQPRSRHGAGPWQHRREICWLRVGRILLAVRAGRAIPQPRVRLGIGPHVH
jgi:hypothetical protein